MIALLLAAALAPTAMAADRIEAEGLTGGRVVQDAGASGGRALQLPREQTVRTVVQTAAPTRVRVRLRAPGAPDGCEREDEPGASPAAAGGS